MDAVWWQSLSTQSWAREKKTLNKNVVEYVGLKRKTMFISKALTTNFAKMEISFKAGKNATILYEYFQNPYFDLNILKYVLLLFTYCQLFSFC